MKTETQSVIEDSDYLDCPNRGCVGTIIPRYDRGHTSWGCNRCYLCVDVDRMARVAMLRGQIAEARAATETWPASSYPEVHGWALARIERIMRELGGGKDPRE